MNLYLPNNMSKKERARQGRILVAGFHFIYTSRDGMVISNLAQVPPRKLHAIVETDEWMACIKFWNPGYKGAGEIEGECYHDHVQRYKMYRSFRFAKSLWKHLFTNPLHRSLNRYFNDLDVHGNEVHDD